MRAKTQVYESSVAGALPAENTHIRQATIKPTVSVALFRPSWRDYFNIGLILASIVAVLLVLSPTRNFSITDDWCYAQSADALLKGAFRPSEYSMATGIGHVAWGAIVEWALGTGLTSLSFATLAMGAVCLVFFYLLLRHLAIPAAWAMLGVTVLGGSPMFIYLSYSFMTDVTFATYCVGALLCYVRAAQHARIQQNSLPLPSIDNTALRTDMWLLAGSIFASLAYLTRQPGLFLPVAVLVYLWWSRSGLTWRRVFALGAVPAVSAAAFMLWQHSYPTTVAAYVEAALRADNFSHLGVFVPNRIEAIIVSLFLVGIMLLPLVRFRRKDLGALLLLSSFLIFQLPTLLNRGTLLPKNMGNIMDDTGMLMQDFGTVPVLSEWFWTAADVISLGVISLFAYAAIRYFLRWLSDTRARYQDSKPGSLAQDEVARRRDQFSGSAVVQAHESRSLVGRVRRVVAERPDMDPAWIVYGFGIAVVGVTSVLAYALMDRYWLPVLPAVLLLALRYNTRNTTRSPGMWRWIIALPLVAFAIVSQQDYKAIAQARWDGGQRLVQQGAGVNQIYMGIEWAGWYLADAGADYFHSPSNTTLTVNPTYDLTDPVYRVSELPHEGYVEIGTVSYQSWLRGQGEVLLLKEKDH